jgi:YgiT-type zinc finger domain-containing protein
MRKVTRSFGRGDSLLVIENIPLSVCRRCHQSYFSARTMHQIDRIKALRGALAVARQVPVAEFIDDESR